MIAILLVVGTVWMAFAAVFVLAMAAAAHRHHPEPDPELGFVVRRMDFTRPADCHRRHLRHAEILLQ
jgi:hypothetical protein